MITQERIATVAHLLYIEVYEQEFGGKTRGRFQVSRDDMKGLLGVQRLHQSTIQRLIDACLEVGLVVIDMDDTFAFAETNYVQKWRKLPSRLAQEHVSSLEKEEEEALDEVMNESDSTDDEE